MSSQCAEYKEKKHWGESDAEEVARHDVQGREMSRHVQIPKNKPFGKGRAMHRRPIAGFKAKLEVLDHQQTCAQIGLFAKAGTYDAVVRLSNAAPMPSFDDRDPGFRGFAIKVFGADGDAHEQDFVLINTPAQFVPTSDEFVNIVLALDGQIVKGAVNYLLGRARKPFVKATNNLLSRGHYLFRLFRALQAPFSGFASEPFFSAAPIACEPHAARIRLQPPFPIPKKRDTPVDLAADLTRRLVLTELRYELQLQFFTHERATPIEDASKDWKTPYTTVAHLIIPRGAVPIDVEHLKFDPWIHIDQHRPLGEMMRSRRAAYGHSRDARLPAAQPKAPPAARPRAREPQEA